MLKGPRGSGKSNYLKRAYFKLQSRENVMVAYINYSQHLALEPLMLRSERALEHFRQWLVYKILLALDESLGEESATDLHAFAEAGRKFVNELQTSSRESARIRSDASRARRTIELDRALVRGDRPFSGGATYGRCGSRVHAAATT